MKRDPAVTVVIPTRDRADLLPDVLGAILNQSRSDLEVIVVDDGSTDETPAVIADTRSRDARVSGLRHDAPRGAAAARNTGAGVATGELLLFEDDDCVSEPDKVERLLAALETRPDAAYAYGWVRMRFPDGSSNVYGGDGPWSITTSCALIRRAAFHDIGEFDEQLPRLQDFDLFTRLLGRYTAVEVPRVLFEMRRDGEGISASDRRLLDASRVLLTKYDADDLPRRHRAAMHRRVGGKLLVRGFWRAGLEHFFVSVRACPRCLRSWVGWAVALLGPPFYRWVARTTYRLGHRRAGGGHTDPLTSTRDGRSH